MSDRSSPSRAVRRAGVVALVLAGVLLAGAGGSPLQSPVKAVSAPDFRQPGLERDRVRLADYRGKVVVLNFWATWCPYCRREIPHLVDLQAELGDRGLQVVGAAMNWKINSREPNDPEIFQQKVSSFALEHGLNYPVSLVKRDMGEVMGGFGSPVGVPYTVLIDRKGRIRATFQGNPGAERLRRAVQVLL